MHEITELADECTVFCNGRSVATFAAGTKTDNEVVELMIGREYSAVFPARRAARRRAPGAPALEVRRLAWTDRLHDISLQLGAGEVVGLGGLDGQGQRELLLALFGVLRGATGEVLVDGKPVAITGPARAKRRRHRHGADPGGPQDRRPDAADVGARQLSLRRARPPCRAGAGRPPRPSATRSSAIVRLLAMRTDGTDVPAGSLSGGNQQKVVIGKWLMMAPRILLLNDPTRGIDVGTKQEIYQLLRELADAGAAILFYSTDYDELVGCCDRVLVMYDGAIRRELVGAEITERALVSERAEHRRRTPRHGSA